MPETADLDLAAARDRLTRAHRMTLDLANFLENLGWSLHTSACQGEPGCPLCELLAVLSGTEDDDEPPEAPAPTPEDRRSEILAALVRGFEAGYDIGAQTDETPRQLQNLRAALNAGDPHVAEAFWASKAWTDDDRKAVARAAEAWQRFAVEVLR